jgi:hypothetical protein
MLFTSGAIPRLGRVDDGSSTSDYDPDDCTDAIAELDADEYEDYAQAQADCLENECDY